MYITRKILRVTGCTVDSFIACLIEMAFCPLLFRGFHDLQVPGTNSFLLGLYCDLTGYETDTLGFNRPFQYNTKDLF